MSDLLPSELGSVQLKTNASTANIEFIGPLGLSDEQLQEHQVQSYQRIHNPSHREICPLREWSPAESSFQRSS